MGRIVRLRGEFVAAEEARVSIFDRGYQLGEGVFATMRAYAGRCFRAERHLEQLSRGATALGLVLPAGLAELAELANTAARRTGEADARVRVTITDTTTSIVAEKLIPPSAADYANGIAAAIVGPRRIPPECFDGTIKATSYAASLVARRAAEAKGAAEGIQLAVDGSLACGTMANLFVVRAGELATPALASGCRGGVTRAEILDLAGSTGLAPTERRIDVDELFAADEAFFTNTRVECLPIASVDGRALRRGSHGAALRQALRARAGAVALVSPKLVPPERAS